jgi:hypothetical protein
MPRTRQCPPTHLDFTRNPVAAVQYDGTNATTLAELTGYQALVGNPGDPIRVSFDGQGSKWYEVRIGSWLIYDIAGDDFKITTIEPAHPYTCTCELINPGSTGPDLEPPSYEQDPLCLVHFDIDRARHDRTIDRNARAIDDAALAILVNIANPTKVAAIARSHELVMTPEVRECLEGLADQAMATS